jgi:hypothetical protein
MQSVLTISLFKTLVEQYAKEEKWKKRVRFGPINLRAGWKASPFMLELMPNVFDNLHYVKYSRYWTFSKFLVF